MPSPPYRCCLLLGRRRVFEAGALASVRDGVLVFVGADLSLVVRERGLLCGIAGAQIARVELLVLASLLLHAVVPQSAHATHLLRDERKDAGQIIDSQS